MRKYVTWFIIAGALLIQSCLVTAPRNTRYIAYYEDFQQIEAPRETWLYQRLDKHAHDYPSFYLDQVTVYPNPQKAIKTENRPLYDELGTWMKTRAAALVSNRHVVAKTPDKKALRVRITAVDIKPYVWLKKDAGRVLKSDSLTKGTKFELECLDPATGEQIFVLSTLFIGEPYTAYEDAALIPNLKPAFDEWMAFLLERMDQGKD